MTQLAWFLAIPLAAMAGFWLCLKMNSETLAAARTILDLKAEMRSLRELTARFDRTLEDLAEQKKRHAEWMTRLEKMDVTQAAIVTALARMGAIAVARPNAKTGDLLLGERPDSSSPETMPRSRRGDGHI